jgi:hypothetical protein
LPHELHLLFPLLDASPFVAKWFIEARGGGNVMLVEVKQAKPFLRENVLSVGVV